MIHTFTLLQLPSGFSLFSIFSTDLIKFRGKTVKKKNKSEKPNEGEKRQQGVVEEQPWSGLPSVSSCSCRLSLGTFAN